MTWLIVGAIVIYVLWATRYFAANMLNDMWNVDGGDITFCLVVGFAIGWAASPFLFFSNKVRSKTRQPLHKHIHRLIIGKKKWNGRYE